MKHQSQSLTISFTDSVLNSLTFHTSLGGPTRDMPRYQQPSPPSAMGRSLWNRIICHQSKCILVKRLDSRTGLFAIQQVPRQGATSAEMEFEQIGAIAQSWPSVCLKCVCLTVWKHFLLYFDFSWFSFFWKKHLGSFRNIEDIDWLE